MASVRWTSSASQPTRWYGVGMTRQYHQPARTPPDLTARNPRQRLRARGRFVAIHQTRPPAARKAHHSCVSCAPSRSPSRPSHCSSPAARRPPAGPMPRPRQPPRPGAGPPRRAAPRPGAGPPVGQRPGGTLGLRGSVLGHQRGRHQRLGDQVRAELGDRAGRHAVPDPVRQQGFQGPSTTSRSTRAMPTVPSCSRARSSRGSRRAYTTSRRSMPARTASCARSIPR